MRKNQINFLLCEFLSAFFILTWEDAVDLLGYTAVAANAFDEIMQDILIPWTWILFALFFMGLGIYQLWGGRYR